MKGTLLVDGWTLKRGEGVLGLNFGFIDEGWNWTIVTLGLVHVRGSHSGQKILESVMAVLHKYGLQEKVNFSFLAILQKKQRIVISMFYLLTGGICYYG